MEGLLSSGPTPSSFYHSGKNGVNRLTDYDLAPESFKHSRDYTAEAKNQLIQGKVN